MKIALIICTLIAIIDLAKTRSADSTTESKEIKKFHKTHTSSGGRISNEMDVKDHAEPKIETEDESGEKRSSYLSTTRRPLMKQRKYTSKPHEVHYVPTLTHAQQSNFSKRRNMNTKKQFKSPNKKSPHSSEDSDSAEHRFRNFTDISDIDKQGQDRRKVNPSKQIQRRRGYPLAFAASEHFRSVSLPSFLKSNKDLLKSKSAIHESLQKIRSIRPGMKEMVTTEAILNKIKSNDYSATKITTNNTDTTEKSVSVASTSENPIYNAKTENVLVISEPTTISIGNSATLTENIQSTSETEKLHSLTTTEKPLQAVAVENLVDSVIKVDNSDLFLKAIQKWDSHRTATKNMVKPGTTTESLYNSTINTEGSILSATTSEKSNDSITQSDKAMHSADNIKSTSQYDLETEKSLVVVMGQSLSVPDMKTSDTAVTTEQNNDANKFMSTKENIITITPIPNGNEGITTEEITHHLALRSKRRVNVIEEERVATTSTGYRFSERGRPITIDFTFKNIHT